MYTSTGPFLFYGHIEHRCCIALQASNHWAIPWKLQCSGQQWKKCFVKPKGFVTVFITLGFFAGTVEPCPHAHSLFTEHIILLPLLGFLSYENFQLNLHVHMPEIMNMLHILQVSLFVIWSSWWYFGKNTIMKLTINFFVSCCYFFTWSKCCSQLFNLRYLQSSHCYDASNMWTEVTRNPEITLQSKHVRLGDGINWSYSVHTVKR